MDIILATHNVLRWLLLLSGAAAGGLVIRGILAPSIEDKKARAAGLIFTILLDIQLLLGLMLYFLFSPTIKAFFSDISTSIQNPTLRYWGIIHSGMMLAAVVFGHLGANETKRNFQTTEKYRRSLIFFGLAVILLVAGTPWFRRLLPW